jgi:hypothetical protein
MLLYRTATSIRTHCEICTLLGYCAASNGNPLPTFWDDVLVPSSRVKKSKKKKGSKKICGLYMESVSSDHSKYASHRPHLPCINCVFSCQLSSSWTSSPLKIWPIHCPNIFVKAYHSTLRNASEERISYEHRSGSLKSLVYMFGHISECEQLCAHWTLAHVT